MKKLATLLLVLSVTSAIAQPGFRHHHHHGYYPGYNYGWVAPTIIGGVIGYEIARNQAPVIIQQPVIVQPAPVTQYYGQTQTQTCTAWTEIRNLDGTVTVTRTCTQ
jgi:hypothetical protein